MKWLEVKQSSCNRNLTGAEQKLLNHFEDLVRSGECKVAQGLDRIRDGAKYVEVTVLVHRAIQAGDVTKSTDPKSIRSGIDKHIGNLGKKGVLGRSDGKVWRTND